MKKRWLFSILAILIVLVAAANAQTDDDEDSDEGTYGGDELAECSDSADNDDDGLIDLDDPGCGDEDDNDETDAADMAKDVLPPALDMTGVKVIRYSVNPSIEVVFSEAIKLKGAYLYAVNEETAAMMAIGLNPPPLPILTQNKTNVIVVWPNIKLFNGLYDLVLDVEDIVGNAARVHQKFMIDVPGTDIKVVEPRMGVSDGSAADLVIETARNNRPEETQCKITTSAFTYDFESAALVPFEPLTWATTHTLANFFGQATFTEFAVFYILCRDRALDRVNRERFEIYIDTTPPTITKFEFNPPKVVEYAEFETMLSVILNATANEPVLCKYSVDEGKSYEEMTPFPGFEKENFDAYTKNNNTAKVYLPEESPATHDIYVQCEDRAGWKTPALKKILEVDLSAGLGINVIEPRPYTTNKSITLKLTTVKRALCYVGEKTPDNAMGADITAKTHSYYLGKFGDGTYTHSIKCISQGVGRLYTQEQELSYTFVIDNTGPSGLNYSGSTATCFADKFVFTPLIELNAVDLESGIAYFLYKMDTSSGMILNWTETSGDIDQIDEDYRGEGFNLSQAMSYRLVAKAVNGAGIGGSETTITIVYDPEDVNCFEKNPPIIVISTNETEGKTIVTIYCEDESGCDNESYYYGLCGTEACEPTTNLQYPFTIDVFDTKYLSYNVSDIRGYSATGTEKIEVKEGKTCNNNVKDGDETDVDCGGSCEGCDTGQSCEVNTDCSDNFCSDGVCAETTCDDNMQNGPYGNAETDVDCGGYCGATCDLNQTCNNDGDCQSDFCNPDEKACQLSSCEDGYKNGGEEGVDCGGECFADCNDKDGDGIDDSWEEKHCNGDCDPDEDMDDDGLTNLEEFRLKTDPTKKDTDGDGYSDGDEVKAGTDPLNPDDYPGGLAGILLLIIGFMLMAGGTGYLAYKKYYVESPVPAAAPAATAAPTKTPEQIETERRRAAEQQRRMMEQRRKQLEERQKKLAELRARIAERREKEASKKREERETLFKKFGFAEAPGATKPSAVRPAAKAWPGAMPKPEPKFRAGPKEGWVSIDKLKEGFNKIAKPAAEKKVKKAEEDLSRKKEEEFNKLEEITGEKPEAKAEKEDVFKEMEKKIKGKKGNNDRQ